MISTRAVVDTRNTGRGPKGKCVAQMVQARASAAIASTLPASGDDAAMTQFLDHLTRQVLGRALEGA